MSARLLSSASRVASVRAVSALPLPVSSLPARCLHAQPAARGEHHVPVGPHSNIDGVYRRPSVPPPSKPLTEHDEMVWPDDQAPEPLFDESGNYDKYTALRNLTGALVALFAGGLGLVWLTNPESRRKVAVQEYPFDNLRLSRGGPHGAPIKKDE